MPKKKEVKREKEENLHAKHRARLKEKFLKAFDEGTLDDVFVDHELIELLLFFSVPRQNTNEIAHRLLNEFGNIAGIFDAEISSLLEIKDLGPNSALLFKVVSNAAKRYINDVNDIAGARLNPDNINEYIKNLFYGHTNEIAYVLFLDSGCVVRKIKRLSSGTVNATPLYPRDVVKMVVNERYPYIILAHNHPNGNEMPSSNDIEMTKIIEMALSFIEVRLVDHVIVSGDKVTSLARKYGLFRN